MTERFIEVKEVALKNNCPECYSNSGLRLTFKQKVKETYFYKAITSEMSHEISCLNCKSIIYPVKWTDDIDRVFEYHKKAFTPKRTSTFLKKASWIALIAVFTVVTVVLILLFYSKF